MAKKKRKSRRPLTKRYKSWRKAVFRRDKFICQRCRKSKTYLNAHHIRPWSIFPAYRYNVENGVSLCIRCHTKVHKSKRSKFLILYG